MKKLDRSLGLPSVVAVSVSAMIGSGIFVLPGLGAAATGPSVWLAYVVAALAVLPAALSKAELATAMPTSGGSYVFLDRCFGPMWGTVAGVGLWLSLLLKSSFALVGMAAYLVVLTDAPATLVDLIALFGIVTLNVVGVRKVGKLLVVVAALSVVALGALVTLSAPSIEPTRFTPFLSDGVGGLAAAAGLVFASYNGVTKVASIAEEVERPERNLPAGILLSLSVVAVLYAAVAVALAGVLPLDALRGDVRPIHSLASAVGGRWVGVGAAALGVVTLASMANAGLLAASRYPFAMSRGRAVPPLFGRLSARFHTPLASILITGALMAAVIILFDVESIAKLASATVLAIFIAENLALVAFRESRARWYKPSWRSPLYPWVQILGVLAASGLLVMLGDKAVFGIVASVVPGLLIYFMYGRSRTDRRSLFALLGRRAKDPVERRTLAPPPFTTSSQEGEAEAVESAAVVALLGGEHSVELLAELGGALADGGTTTVVDVQHVHDGTEVDATRDDDDRLRSLERRLAATQEVTGMPLRLEVHLSRDPPGSVDHVSGDLHCRWVVMGWRPRGALLSPYNPLGWMLDHIDANVALFRDLGVRYVRELLVVTEGDELDPLVLDTSDHLAEVWGANVTVVRWTEGAETDRQERTGSLSEDNPRLAKHIAVTSMDEIESITALTAGFDMVVMSRERQTWLRQLLRKSRHEQIATQSACSVLLLQSPPMT